MINNITITGMAFLLSFLIFLYSGWETFTSDVNNEGYCFFMITFGIVGVISLIVCCFLVSYNESTKSH